MTLRASAPASCSKLSTSYLQQQQQQQSVGTSNGDNC
jgi:hypothetical protein